MARLETVSSVAARFGFSNLASLRHTDIFIVPGAPLILIVGILHLSRKSIA